MDDTSAVNAARRRLMEQNESGFPITLRTPCFEITLTQAHAILLFWFWLAGVGIGVGGVKIMDWVSYAQSLEIQQSSPR